MSKPYQAKHRRRGYAWRRRLMLEGDICYINGYKSGKREGRRQGRDELMADFCYRRLDPSVGPVTEFRFAVIVSPDILRNTEHLRNYLVHQADMMVKQIETGEVPTK